jgi:hypothetical protein
MKKYSLYFVALVALIAIGSLVLVGGRFAAHAQGPGGTLSGWAWSSNIGWLSFNSADTGAGGGPYGVSVDSNGDFSGYAWSPNIGWVSFGPNSCGTQPNVNLSSGAVSGWAQAVAADNNGWNGCIELSGTNHSTSDSSGNSGVSYVTSGSNAGQFVGYAWGSTNIGWLQFNPSTSVSPVKLCQTGDTTCTCQPDDPTCNNEAAVALSVLNSGIYASFTTVVETGGNASANIQWSSTNVKPSSCEETGDWSSVSNASAFNSTLSQSSNSSNNTGTLSFTGVSDGDNVSLEIQCKDQYNKYVPSTAVSISFTKGSTGNTCVAPAHSASPCGPIDSGSATTVSSCLNNTTECQYLCASGYTAKNNMCVKSSIQEI